LSKASVTKIKRAIGQLRSREELRELESHILARKDTLNAQEQDAAWQSVKKAKPGNRLLARAGNVAGRVYEVGLVQRIKRIIWANSKAGGVSSITLGTICEQNLLLLPENELRASLIISEFKQSLTTKGNTK
jgi:hypothetical protein